MIYDVKVTNPSGDSMGLNLAKPESSGWVVLNIDGLGPGKSTINVRESSQSSGGVFNSAKTPSRNIVVTLKFLPLPTIEATRLRTYKYFPLEGRVRFDITTETGMFYIYGYVESNEPVIFTENAGCVISILCPDPAFRVEDGLVSGDIVTVVPAFNFPFPPAGQDTFTFGDQFFQSEMFPIVNDGTINVAPTLFLYARGGQVNDPRIYFYDQNNPNLSGSIGFKFTDSLPLLEDGDFLTIVCEKTNKSVTRYHAGDFINYIGALALDTTWPVLRPGTNYFSYSAVTGSPHIRIGYEYTRLYTGV